MLRPTAAGRCPCVGRRCGSSIRTSAQASRPSSAPSPRPRRGFAGWQATTSPDLSQISDTSKRDNPMRFMVIVKASKDSEAGKMPSEELLDAMAKFNEDMVKAGILLDAAGLQPSSKGARIRFSGNKRTVIDGPFAETKELIAGYWIIQVKSIAEAIEWMKRCPNPHEEDGEIEIRQLFEMEDFGESPAVEYHKAVGERMARQKN